jgi:hypothetical protein
MGKVGKVIAGIGLIVTGAVIGIFTQNWSLAFAVASLGAGLLTQPKMPKLGGSDLNERTGAILENRVGALQYLPVIYGTAKIAGVFADIRVDDLSQARKRLVLVPAFCHGSRDGTGITGIDEVWFDDRKAVDGSTVQSPFDATVLPGGATVASKYLVFEHHLGSSSQAADTRLTTLFPNEWKTASQGRGVCYSRLELWYDSDKYPGGIPTVQIKARGNVVYDVRDNSWKFSTNPALCIRDYILSPIYGLGIAQANIDEQSFVDMANYCDELVNIPATAASCSKTALTSAWDEQVYSTQGFAGGAYASSRAVGHHSMFGLNTDPLTNASYDSIDYAWYTTSGNALYIYENAAQVAGPWTWAVGDLLEVTYTFDGTNWKINYLHNGINRRSITVSAGLTLFYDSSFYYIGAPNPGWTEMKFGSSQQFATFGPFIASAGVSLTVVGGTQKRYELNGWVDTSRSVEQNLAELCSSCRGQVVNEADRWRMIIRRARQVTGFKITEKNTIEGAWQFILPGADLCPNVARASYIDPSRNYTVDTVQFPEPGQTNPFLTEDNAYEQRLEMDLPFTNNRLMGQQIAMTLMRESREAIGVICTLREEGIQCRVGDLVEVTYPTPGWVDKIFDVAALMLQPDALVRVVLIEYEPTVYDLNSQFLQPIAQNTNLPNPFTVLAPSGLVLVSVGQELLQSDGGYIPRIRTTWTKSNDPFVDYYQVQARRAATGDSVEVAAPFASSAFSHSGMTAFTAAKIWNDILTVTGEGGTGAWHTDSAVPGAWLQLDCGAGVTKEYVECRMYLDVGGVNNGRYDIEYSDNGSSWTLARSTGAGQLLGAMNSFKWASVGAHRYWRIKLTNTPGSGAWMNELQFLEGAWDEFGRVSGLSEPLIYVYPVTADESWTVRVRAVNKIGVTSSWISLNHIPVVLDPRPQVLSITLTNAHSDIGHIDTHTDISHGDAGHSDAHTDTAHTDHTDHTDGHSDAHTDSGHGDSHTDFHADHGDGASHTDIGHYDTPHVDHTDAHGDSHTDGHNDSDHTDIAHLDFHSDHADSGTHSDIGHYDGAHTDHTDSANSHTDVVHVDNHSDTAHSDSAHSDGHTDQSHSDGQFGVGIAIQADQDSASVKAVARKVSINKLLNGGGEIGTVGVQATSWTLGSGNGLLVANDFYKTGSKSLKIVNAGVTDSYSYQDIALLAGKRYRIEGWLKTSALPAADAGFGIAIEQDVISGAPTWTIVEKLTYGDPNAALPHIGIQADGVAHDWTYVFCRFIPSVNCTIRWYCQLGYAGGQSGTGWFDDVGMYEDEPSAVDVRTQQAKDGRNVTIELIDMATGAQIQLNPGDLVRVGAIAYSDVAATGVEGPLALASISLFNIAPVGTDKWVPS